MYNDRHIFQSATLTLNGATDLDVGLVAVDRVRIHRIALTAMNTAAGGAAVVFEDRVDASTDATIESVTIPSSDSVGSMFYTDLATPYVLEPGHRVNLAVTEGGTAPTAVASIIYSIEDKKFSSTDTEVTVSA